jgi:hypothetical protein
MPQLLHCNNPLKAEFSACMEGLALALQWSSLPVLNESDCVQLVAAITNVGQDRRLQLAQALTRGAFD